jgi:hypothetical protein
MSDEEVLWRGAPAASRGLDRQDVVFIVISGHLTLVYWGVIYFGQISPAAYYSRVVLPISQIVFFVLVRPAIRRAQRRNTAFAVTDSRALVLQGPPRSRLDASHPQGHYEAWRRRDGRGTVSFDADLERPGGSILRAVEAASRAILFVLGLRNYPFASRKRKVPQIIFYEVDDLDQLVDAIRKLGLTEVVPNNSVPTVLPLSWRGLLERGFTPSRRAVCAILGVVLVLATVPVIAVRGRDYLQHSPTLMRPGSIETTLSPATYVIFEHTRAMGPYDCPSVSKCATIGPADVIVTSTSGTELDVTGDPKVGSITDGNIHPIGVVAFVVTREDTYKVTVHSSKPAEFIIAKTPSEEVTALAGWIVVGVIGILLILVSLIGVLAARGRRQSHSRKETSSR